MSVVHRRLLSVIVASLPLLAAATASAEAPTRPFGARGEVAIEDLVGIRSSGTGFLSILSQASSSFGPVAPPSLSGLIGYEHDELEQPIGGGGGGRITNAVDMISVAPSLDVFVANRVSLGLTAGFGYGWGGLHLPLAGGDQIERGTAYTVGAAPRVGYVIPLEAGFSLWPRIGVGFTFSRATSSEMIPGQSTRDTSVNLGFRWVGGVDLGVVFRPTRNLFFSATPELSLAHSATGQEVEGAISYIARSTRVRFAGTLSLGVLLGT